MRTVSSLTLVLVFPPQIGQGTHHSPVSLSPTKINSLSVFVVLQWFYCICFAMASTWALIVCRSSSVMLRRPRVVRYPR